MADTIPGDSSTSATISVGGTVSGNLDFVGDHDWFKVTLTAGQAVTISLNGVTLVDPYLNVRDSAGNVVASNDDIVDGSNWQGWDLPYEQRALRTLEQLWRQAR